LLHLVFDTLRSSQHAVYPCIFRSTWAKIVFDNHGKNVIIYCVTFVFEYKTHALKSWNRMWLFGLTCAKKTCWKASKKCSWLIMLIKRVLFTTNTHNNPFLLIVLSLMKCLEEKMWPFLFSCKRRCSKNLFRNSFIKSSKLWLKNDRT